MGRRLDLAPLLRCLTIKTQSRGFQPLDVRARVDDNDADWGGDLGWAQRPFIAEVERQYNARKPVRVIVLKARQLGISTVTEATLFWWAFLHRGTNGLVLAHENKSSAELFEMTKLYWETFPWHDQFDLKYQTKQMLHWLAPIHSRLQVSTAKNIQGGRGFTIHALHASEVAFWLDPDTLWTGLYQTVPYAPGTIVVIESTANGRGGFFYDMWQRATEGDIDFVPLFFPWFKHPSYAMKTSISTNLELSPEEHELVRIGASMENVAWRRWAIRGNKVTDELAFAAEYPSTPEEAFVSTGQPLFSHIHLRKCFTEPATVARGRLIDDPRARVRFQPDPSGPLTVFYAPSPRATYMVAGDPAETVAGDNACIQVINRATNEQVAVWHGRIDPRYFAYEMMRLGWFYNEAMLCPEVEGGGQATIAVLIEKYPNLWKHHRADHIYREAPFTAFGWSTTFNRKRWSIGLLQSLFIDGSCTIHDRVTYNQLLNFVNDDGYWGDRSRAQGRGDDAVMALAIAVAASSVEPAPMPMSTSRTLFHDLYDQEYGEDVDWATYDREPPMPKIRSVGNPDGAFQ